MRRNLLTSILWFTAVVLFLLHLILVRKQDEKNFGDLVYRQQKDLSNTESPSKYTTDNLLLRNQQLLHSLRADSTVSAEERKGEERSSPFRSSALTVESARRLLLQGIP